MRSWHMRQGKQAHGLFVRLGGSRGSWATMTVVSGWKGLHLFAVNAGEITGTISLVNLRDDLIRQIGNDYRLEK